MVIREKQSIDISLSDEIEALQAQIRGLEYALSQEKQTNSELEASHKGHIS